MAGNYYGFFGFDQNGRAIISTVSGRARKPIIILESRGFNKAYYENLLTIQYVQQLQAGSVRRVDQSRLNQLPQLQPLPVQAQPQPQPQQLAMVPVQPQPAQTQQTQLQQFTNQPLPYTKIYIMYMEALFRFKIINYQYRAGVIPFWEGENNNAIIDKTLGWYFSQFRPLELDLTESSAIRNILDYVRPIMIKRFKDYFSANLELIADDYYTIFAVVNGRKFKFVKRTFLIN